MMQSSYFACAKVSLSSSTVAPLASVGLGLHLSASSFSVQLPYRIHQPLSLRSNAAIHMFTDVYCNLYDL